MILRRFASTAFAFLSLSVPLAASSLARADGPPVPTSPAPAEEAGPIQPSPKAFRYDGRALYAGVGSGVIADLQEPTFNGRLLATFPVARWAMIEGFALGYHYSAVGPQDKRADSLGLGIGIGFRMAASPDARFRPHLALRAEHVHMTPDLWGTPSPENGSDPSANTSIHRWGAALAAGVDTPLLGPSSRWRVGLEMEATALSGPAANVYVTGYANLGFAL